MEQEIGRFVKRIKIPHGMPRFYIVIHRTIMSRSSGNASNAKLGQPTASITVHPTNMLSSVSPAKLTKKAILDMSTTVYPANGSSIHPIFVESKTRTYHGRVGAGRRTAVRRGGAGRGRAGLDADGSVRPGDNRPACLPGHRRQLFCMILWKREHRKSHVNRWGNKTCG